MKTQRMVEPGTRLDVPGTIRRVRRLRDFSQRDLAVRLRVNRSTVARWETGELEPSLSTFQDLLALADLELVPLDPQGEAVGPMRDDTVRDAGGRRYAAHLDVVTFDVHAPVSMRRPESHRCAPHRPVRDCRRAATGTVPRDHPSHYEWRWEVETFQTLRWVRARALMERVRESRRARGVPDPFATECTCDDDCFEVAGCVPRCPCVCQGVVVHEDGRKERRVVGSLGHRVSLAR